MIAVLTADLVNSSNYNEELLSRVLTTLKEQFNKITSLYGPELKFKIYRGDSFQGIINIPEKSLEISLILKTAINAVHSKENSRGKAYVKEADLKMAIGIGSYEFERPSIAESNGQAFQFSGRSLDDLKKESRTIILKTPRENINAEFNASFLLLDTLMDKWSIASAEVIYYLLRGLKEQEIAEKLQITQSAVNQRKKAAGWEAVSVLLQRYQQVIAKNF
ncbi:SatD family protein [Autumnicola edwardsiae]|uniref:SatD family protein n=1 Tax=Autumnicola edwardsiae TaxID=3075594 RepID=A0ABU3CSJ9_9FLAO|nr:SatD family protein [Zunongwangia sp. F297]MDT0649325.1 SatD family protein [Zunongwangia sp. F297]